MTPLLGDHTDLRPVWRSTAVRPVHRRASAVALLAGALAIGATGCGKEHVSRAEVIDALTKNGVDRSLAECVMEAMPQSDLDDLATANSELTPDAADRVAQVAADCATEQVDKTTTTTAKPTGVKATVTTAPTATTAAATAPTTNAG